MKKTIKSKLLISYLAISGITIFLIISVLYGFIYIRKTSNTVDSATKLSKIMGTNLAASLSFDDTSSAKNILKSLRADNAIEAAFIYDRNEKLFSSLVNGIEQEEAIKILELLRNDSIYYDIDNIIVSSKISLDNETIGKLILIYNTDDIKNTLKQIIQILFIISIFILIIMSKIASVLQIRLTAPIYILVNTMKNILEHNDYTKTINAKSDDEFQTVFDGFNAMLNTIQKNKSELESLANTDPLTKLSNRRHFFELVNQFLNISARDKINSSVLMMDIDKFKNVNDTYGHDVGDLVIQGLAKIISENIRKGDVYARFGGEEFIVFLPYANYENAMVVAEKIRKCTEAYRGVENVKFTISIGVSEFTDDIYKSIKKADNALYRAKETGRNKIVYDKE